jgi:methionine-rich copper-binding protein CopC
MTNERFVYSENGVPRPSPALPPEPPEEEPEHLTGEAFADRVVSYLLGRMSEEESEQFEDECFAQKSWPSQIKLVEEELIDAYLHHDLSPEQRELFERNYLTTETRQERVRVAAALLRQVCRQDDVVEQPVVGRAEGTWAERLKAFWGGRTWGFRVASAVAALVIIGGVSWLYLSRVRPPRAVATLRLTSSVINRSEGVQAHTIKLPPDADALRVFLTLPDNATPAPRYRVELDDLDNEDGETTTLAVEGREAHAVTVLIPASRLRRGQYALTLFAVSADGNEQPVFGSYVFAVK